VPPPGGVGGDGPLQAQSAAAGRGGRGGEQPGLLLADEPRLAGVGVQSGRKQAVGPTGDPAEGPVERAEEGQLGVPAHGRYGFAEGPVMAGIIGKKKYAYDVWGETVNLASRIEALNKPFGTDILISEDSWKLVKDIYAVERMQTIKVKGKVAPLQIYAVLGRLGDPDRPKSLQELRRRLGIKEQPFNRRWDDGGTEGEVKYEILEK
jgi:hypothetical protein